MNRPDLAKVLSPLKPFQQRTVDHAFERLFVAPDSTARFLVADEVGLGKTLVARGIIARAIDHLWDDVERIDIIYICSNASIARANLPKLKIGGTGERSFALATRLTLLATQLAPRDRAPGMAESKLNFVSFTPGTSFEMGHSTGRGHEREVLFRLLESRAPSRTALMNLLQGTITRTDSWRWRLDNPTEPLDPSIASAFGRTFDGRTDLREELDELTTGFFRRTRQEWPPEARWRRNRLIGELRHLLAKVCIDAFEPDLVILDEFQRFKHLLEDDPARRDPAADLAQELFGAVTPEGNPVRTLLLSATPYKLYTADAEIEQEDHYADFLATTRFLMGGDQDRVDGLQKSLSGFGGALKRAAAGAPAEVRRAKEDVERRLRSVMARTERVAASDDRDAMVEEPRVQVELSSSDVQQYLAADALFQAVGDRDPMPYWKSAPYLPHFMQGYRVNARLDEAIERSPAEVARVLREHANAFLQAEEIRTWQALGPANAKLRELSADLLESGMWRLLWMPATVPYWPHAGAYERHTGRTKTLLFSAWNVVPDVVSGVLSYEAERLMFGGSIESYAEPNKQQVPLLRLAQSQTGTRSRHRLLLLLLPCLGLADRAHPLSAPERVDRRMWVRSRVTELLADPSLPDPQEGEVDDRWEWAAPFLLDPGLGEFVAAWAADESLPRPNAEVFRAYAADLAALDSSSLGRRPEGLEDLLVELALGGPAVLAARTLLSAGIADQVRRRLSVVIADAFWRLFNRPAVIRLLAQLAEDDDVTREEGVYWRQVLRYCRDGNLQSVLDEEWHLLWEQKAWSETETPESIAEACSAGLAATVEPTPSRVHARTFALDPDDPDAVSRDEVRLRTDFALRFGDIRTEERLVTQDAVRAAFNSPFRPFVLASTSVGQEGLDFHPWCHRLVHWNLPGNPVDLEQREGRVHRYKGHAVRQNVAAEHAVEALRDWSPGDDLWARTFALANAAARARQDSDLVPYWIAPGSSRVQRHVPLLPYTKEVDAFRRLKRQLAAYRVVFGQPRQEELVTLLDRADVDEAELREWAIDLAPYGK